MHVRDGDQMRVFLFRNYIRFFLCHIAEFCEYPYCALTLCGLQRINHMVNLSQLLFFMSSNNAKMLDNIT